MRSTTRSTLLRRIGLAAVAPIFVAGLAACGDSGSSDAGTVDSPSSSDTGADTGDSAPADVTYEAGDDVDPTAFFDAFSKAMTDGKTAKVAMKMPSVTANGAISYGTNELKMDLTMDAEGQTGIHMIVLDGKFFMSLPGVVPDGKFLSIDPATMGLGDLSDQLKGTSPADLASSMKGAVTKLTVVGSEQVDGDDTTHFTMTVDPAKAADIIGTELPDGADASSATYDLWVGKDNLLRKVLVGVAGQQVEMTYSDWGKPVDIAAPAAGDIVDMSSLGATS